jgi:aerobic-type carbon monoxide dehydrogenase small subunit (CoxS/CutS family)
MYAEIAGTTRGISARSGNTVNKVLWKNLQLELSAAGNKIVNCGADCAVHEAGKDEIACGENIAK